MISIRMRRARSRACQPSKGASKAKPMRLSRSTLKSRSAGSLKDCMASCRRSFSAKEDSYIKKINKDLEKSKKSLKADLDRLKKIDRSMKNRKTALREKDIKKMQSDLAKSQDSLKRDMARLKEIDKDFVRAKKAKKTAKRKAVRSRTKSKSAKKRAKSKSKAKSRMSKGKTKTKKQPKKTVRFGADEIKEFMKIYNDENKGQLFQTDAEYESAKKSARKGGKKRLFDKVSDYDLMTPAKKKKYKKFVQLMKKL